MATASDLPFYNIFAPQKVPFLENFFQKVGPSAEQLFVHGLIILAIHFELLMQPIVVIEDVGTLLGYKFNNINNKTNNSMVKDDNWELIQLGLLLLNSYDYVL